MKRILFSLFAILAIGYESFGQTADPQAIDFSKLIPSNGYGSSFKRMRVENAFALPSFMFADTTDKAPGQIKIIGENVWYTDASGVWRTPQGGTGTSNVEITQNSGTSLSINNRVIYFHGDNAPATGGGALDVYVPYQLPSDILRSSTVYSDPVWLNVSQAKVTGLVTALNGKAALNHTHSFSTLTDVPVALQSPFTKSQADLLYAGLNHGHAVSSISGLQDSLDTKVTAILGKKLSDRNYTSADSIKLAGLSNTGGISSIPIATATVLGGIKQGTGFTIDPTTGVANVSSNTTPVSAAWGTITGSLSSQADIIAALNLKVNANTAITGGTASKVTWDTKGLITGFSTLTSGDVSEITNKRFVSDAQLALIGNQVNVSGNAATVTTNANLTGPVTSLGNATAIGAGVITNSHLFGNIAASKLVGTDIATVGTITNGTWNGTAITSTYLGSNLAFGGSPTMAVTPISTDSSTKVPNTAFVKKAVGDLPNLVIDTVTTSTGMNPIYASDAATITTRALMPSTNEYDVVRDTDTTFHLNFKGGVLTTGAQTFTGAKAFNANFGIGVTAADASFRLYVQNSLGGVATFRSTSTLGPFISLDRYVTPTAVDQRLGSIQFKSTNNITSASFGAYADKVFIDGVTAPTSLRGFTTPDSGAVAIETFRITSNGAITNGGDAAANTVLDIQHATLSNGNKGGVLFPKVSLAERTALSTGPDGLIVYQTDGVRGLYILNGTTDTWLLLGTLGNGQNYALQGGMPNTTLAANTIYYAGAIPSYATSTQGFQNMTIPKGGNITKLKINYVLTNGTTATATEGTRFYIIVTPASTGVAGTPILVSTTAIGASLKGTINLNTLAIPVQEDDQIELKIVTPTTAGTLPSGFRLSFSIFIET